MRMRAFLAVALVMVLGIGLAPTADARLKGLLKDAKKAIGGGRGLSDGEIIDGLKEALTIGTGNAVSTVSKDGSGTRRASAHGPSPSRRAQAPRPLAAE